jgi:exosortase A-associated hydrolase 2
VGRPGTEAFYLDRGDRRLFCMLISPPQASAGGCLLHVPAFAEEMNKSRRVVANAARALALRGWTVLLPDLGGTGDSSGDFSGARWQDWIEDVQFAARWLERRNGAAPGLWGLRAGCLLLQDALAGLDCGRVLLWQPAANGESVLTQFLRLRSMGAAAKGGAGGPSTKSLLLELEAGACVDVAGYRLPPGLALPLRGARLQAPACAGKKLLWLEVSSAVPPALLPASQALLQQMRDADIDVDARCVAGTPFWMTQEIDECDALVEATVAALEPAPVS